MSGALLFHVASQSIGALIDEGKYLYGVEQNVRKLQEDLQSMQSHLQRVDSNPYLPRDDPLLLFTKSIRGLAFRAEDVIDTYVVDVGTKIDRKNLFLKSVCYMSHSCPVHMLIKEIESIQQDIQEATKRFQNFNIPDTPQQPQSGTIESNSHYFLQNNIHLLDDQFVVGIHDDIDRLVKRLTDPGEDFKVLAIHGTGGAGKSTLARELFHHSLVAKSFSCKAFVRVSQEWNGADLLRRIFNQVKGKDGSAPSEDNLAGELKAYLDSRQCLIVVDDIWHTEAWDAIRLILPRNKSTSYRVILTTRIQQVSMHADNNCIPHEPQPLTKDQKWELFSKLAMEGRVGIQNNARFKELGEQMLEKCEPLPFAVVKLAGILRTKKEFSEWEVIGKALNEFIFQDMRALLELSYVDLPPHIRPCFLYLAIIPEDCDIEAHMLTQMWIAEGFITNDDAATLLLNELARRYILQVISKSVQGHIERFRLHGLMRKLCIEKAKDYQFLWTTSSTNQHEKATEHHFPGTIPSLKQNTQPRRIAIFSREYSLEDYNQLRTLVQFDPSFGNVQFDPDGAIKKLESLEKFKLLRVLNIRGVEHVALPKHIGNLVQLRYLGINAAKISKLPKSIRNLRNLLYLYICSSGDLEAEDPIDLLSKMENLRGIALPHLIHASFSSLGLNRSKELQALTSGAGTWMIKELPTLSCTVKNVEIYEIKEMEEIEAIYQCPCIIEGGLCTLKCNYNVSGLEFDLEKLMQCTTLWSLELHGLLKGRCERAIQFPAKLEKLCLDSSGIEEWPDLMQVLGDLYYLKYLSLTCRAYLGKQLHCTASAFPELQELHLVSLEKLEEWTMEEGAMSRLSKIDIENCLELKKLPESIKSITTLKELNIRTMPKEFYDRLGNGGADYSIVEKNSVKVTYNIDS